MKHTMSPMRAIPKKTARKKRHWPTEQELQDREVAWEATATPEEVQRRTQLAIEKLEAEDRAAWLALRAERRAETLYAELMAEQEYRRTSPD